MSITDNFSNVLLQDWTHPLFVRFTVVKIENNLALAATWIRHGSSQYYFSANEETRDNAQSCCQAAGGNLSSVTTEREAEFIEYKFVFGRFHTLAVNPLSS